MQRESCIVQACHNWNNPVASAFILVQCLNSPFLPHVGTEPGRAKRRVSSFRPLGFSPFMGAGRKGELRNWTRYVYLRQQYHWHGFQKFFALEARDCRVAIGSFCNFKFDAFDSWLLHESEIQVQGNQGRVVRKPVNTNPGLKVNRDNNFSCIKMFSTAYVLCSLRLLKLKVEGQTTCTENLTEKLKKKWNQNSR